MPSELDRKFDAVLAEVIGPEGGWSIGRDERGPGDRRQFPGDAADSFDDLLRAQRRESRRSICRRRAADLRRARPHVGPAGARRWPARGIGKGDRVGIAMRNCPAWIVTYMAVLKAGGVATLLNGWWQADELEHALQLTEPKLILADAAAGEADRRPRATSRRSSPADRASRSTSARAAARWRRRGRTCPKSRPKTTRPSCSPRARPARPRARCRPTAR